MSAEVTAEFRYMYMVYRAGYNRLCSEALDSGRCRWPVRPKAHFVEHLAFDIAPLNGRFLHNFNNEDFIRRIKHLAMKSHPAHLSSHVVLKYTLQRCLLWRMQ